MLCQGCQKKVNGPLQDGEEFLLQVEKFIWVLFISEGKVKEEVDRGAVMVQYGKKRRTRRRTSQFTEHLHSNPSRNTPLAVSSPRMNEIMKLLKWACSTGWLGSTLEISRWTQRRATSTRWDLLNLSMVRCRGHARQEGDPGQDHGHTGELHLHTAMGMPEWPSEGASGGSHKEDGLGFPADPVT